jgi:hypothetical protein
VKESVLLNNLVIGVYSFFIFFMPLTRSFRSFRYMQVWQSPTKGVHKQLRQIDAGLPGCGD